MTALSRVFLAIYQSFPTTLQEDRALQGSQHSGQHAMALTYRISMKEALERALQRTLARIHGMAATLLHAQHFHSPVRSLGRIAAVCVLPVLAELESQAAALKS